MDEERLGQIERQLMGNQQSTKSLRESVEALREPLDTLAEIQQEQREIRAAADAAAKTANTLAVQSKARDKRTRKALRIGGLVAVAVLLLVTTLTFVALIGYVRDLIDQDQKARYPGCMTRNQAVSVQAQRERTLSALPAIPAPERQVHADSARQLEGLLVDCTQYLNGDKR